MDDLRIPESGGQDVWGLQAIDSGVSMWLEVGGPVGSGMELSSAGLWLRVGNL